MNILLSMPKLGFVVATRAALGVGIGLLISERLDDRRRKAVGTALVTAGALATIPAVMLVARGRRRRRRAEFA